MKVTRSASIGLAAGLVGLLAINAISAPGESILGACCIDAGTTCIDISTADTSNGEMYCESIFGAVYLGDGTSCDLNPCVTIIQLGACCLPITGIEELACADGFDELTCEKSGGTYFGDGTFCGIFAGPVGVECSVDVFGSCCFSNGECHEIVPEAACDEAGGSFSLELCSSYLCVPENDECTSATALSGQFPIVVDGALDDASEDEAPCLGKESHEGKPEPLNGVSLPGVWYTVEGTGDQLYARLCGIFKLGKGSDVAYDFQISVYCGPCFDLQCVAYDDDGCLDYAGQGESNGQIGLPSVQWCSEAGVTYYIHVTGFAVEIDDVTAGPPLGSQGYFELTMETFDKPCETEVVCEPELAGADFCDTLEGSICTDVVYFENTFSATNNIEFKGGNFQTEVMHCGVWFGFYDNWYVYRPAWDGQVFFNVYGVNNPTLDWVFAIYPSCEPNEDEQIACNDPQHATIFLDVKRGEEYYLRVAARGYERGEYEVVLTGPDCAPDPSDLDNSGVPDIQECIEDVNGDGVVDFADFVQVIVAFNQCLDCCCDPVEDVDGDTHVDPADAIIVYNAIGRVCPMDGSMQDFFTGRRPSGDSPKGVDTAASNTLRP
jgi:hypothetical protein